MEERKSNLLSRFWPPSASRRSSTTQTAPTTTSTRTTKSQPNSQTSPTSAPPTRAETKIPARKAKARKGDRAPPKPGKLPPREVQKTSQQSTTPTDEPKKTSSKPASPQPRSPPQPSSPSHAAPKEPSKPHSPLRTPPRSPRLEEGTLPASPSKGSTKQEPSSIEKDPKPAAPQQKPETKEEVKPDSPKAVNEPEPPSELKAKPEETKDVKEVVQATNVEANEETKKEVTYSAAPKSISGAQVVEKAEKQETLDTKEILETPANATADRNKNSDKSAIPNGKQVPLHENTKADMSEMEKRNPAKAISDRPVSVITLAGDNRGASMKMEPDSSKKEGPIHINRSYKIKPADESHDGEERSSEGKESSVEEQLTEAYVNNNTQGINNSIVFDSSIVEGNPGVHLVFSHLPKEPIQSKDKASFPETRKADVNMSRS